MYRLLAISAIALLLVGCGRYAFPYYRLVAVDRVPPTILDRFHDLYPTAQVQRVEASRDHLNPRVHEYKIHFASHGHDDLRAIFYSGYEGIQLLAPPNLTPAYSVPGVAPVSDVETLLPSASLALFRYYLPDVPIVDVQLVTPYLDRPRDEVRFRNTAGAIWIASILQGPLAGSDRPSSLSVWRGEEDGR